MPNFSFKDGREGEIVTWGFKELKQCTDFDWPTEVTGTWRHIHGFGYFGEPQIRHIETYIKVDYSKEESLSPMEVQNGTKLKTADYHKALVALSEGDLIGVLLLPWMKDRCPFWRYQIQIIDVHKDFRNQGVATALIQELEISSFLDNKIIQRGPLTPDGAEYSDKVFQRLLKAEHYALIPSDYAISSPPETPGIYDAVGRLIS